MNDQPLLLIIDDEISILKTLREILNEENYRVEILSDGHKALDTIGKLIPDLVLLDIFMPNCNGIKLLEKIKKEYPQQKVIMISGFGNVPIAIESIKKGALDFIEKPFNLDEILSKINFLKKTDQQNFQKNLKTKQEIEPSQVIGQSYLFLELIQQVEQVSKINFPLIIYGQHGTGKTTITKYIQQKNQLNKEDFFLIDCSSLQKKEFSQKIENIFLKEKGLIFIKNIDQLELEGQKNLLSKLEDYDKEKIKIVISSCTSLFNLVKEDRFNSALFHKLNITPIEIPPLNKRRYDIPLLIDHFLKQANQKYNKSIIFNNKSIRILRNHNWTENVAELKALVEKIVSSTSQENQVICSDYLFNFLKEKKTQIIEEQSFLSFNSLEEATNEFEKNFLIHLLKKNKYDIKQVSERLNLTTIQLRDKMLKFNINVKF